MEFLWQNIQYYSHFYIPFNNKWILQCKNVNETDVFFNIICSHFGASFFSTYPLNVYRGKSPIMGRFPNMGRCIISYQGVLRSLLKNVNHQAHEALLCNHSINSQLLRTSVLTGRVCFDALWDFCLWLNCDSWDVEGKLFFWISLVLSSLLSVILNTCFGSLVEF